jgi:26S proteasome regulatory subunit N2
MLTSYLSSSEALSEPTSELSPEARNLASLLCSKIYFYLGAINDAVNAALNAGDAFTRDHAAGTREYKETIICEWERLGRPAAED